MTTPHPEFAAMVAEAVRAANPKASDALIALTVRGVAASPEFAPLASFMDRGLASGMYAAAIEQQAQVIAGAAAKVEAGAVTQHASDGIPADVWARMTPREKLARHYTAEAGERTDVESVARAERIASGTASAADKLAAAHGTNPTPTKADKVAARKAEAATVKTADLGAIVDPTRRLEEFRKRSLAAKSVERLELEARAYRNKALDKNVDPQTRAAANIELGKIEARLRELET